MAAVWLLFGYRLAVWLLNAGAQDAAAEFSMRVPGAIWRSVWRLSGCCLSAVWLASGRLAAECWSP